MPTFPIRRTIQTRINTKKPLIQRLLALGYQDSNLESQDQNLKCYHYTIAQ